MTKIKHHSTPRYISMVKKLPLLVIVIYISYVLFHLISTSRHNIHYKETPIEYLDIFKLNQHKNIDTKYTLGYDKNYPTGIWKYNSSYLLVVHKIANSNKMVLPRIIQDENIRSPYNTVIAPTGNNIVDISIIMEPVKYSGLLYFSFDSSHETLIQNDSTVIYNTSLGKFSLKYEEDGKQDYVTKNERGGVPIQVAVLRRRGQLFLIMMTIEKRSIVMNRNSLLDIIQ